jgi:hypothetical protein
MTEGRIKRFKSFSCKTIFMTLPGFYVQSSTMRYNGTTLKFIDQYKGTNLIVPAIDFDCISRCNREIWVCDADTWAECSRRHDKCIRGCM